MSQRLTRVVFQNGHEVDLTPGEIRAIEALVQANGTTPTAIQYNPGGIQNRTLMSLELKGILVPTGATYTPHNRSYGLLCFPLGLFRPMRPNREFKLTPQPSLAYRRNVEGERPDMSEEAASKVLEAASAGRRLALASNKDDANLREVCVRAFKDPWTAEERYLVEIWEDPKPKFTLDYRFEEDARRLFHQQVERLGI